ncbi:MAG TPA: hypothetical protein VMT97_12610 [Terriglobales bacterium]|nr:hypothetical protein [Terriglobales bacterium]
MRPFQNVIRFGLAGLFVLLAAAEVAWTQAPFPVPPPENNSGYGLFAAVLVVAMLALAGIGAKLCEVRQKREEENRAVELAVTLQGRLSDALLTEPSIARLPIMPTVRVSPGPDPQAVILLTGMVPAPRFREAALRLVSRVAASLANTYRIENRLVVYRQMSRRTA